MFPWFVFFNCEMAQGKSDEVKQTQETYVEKRMEGVPAREAARTAGYSDATKIAQIERVGGPVHEKLQQALADKGMDDKWLVGEYADGIEACKQRDARDKDLNAHAQYLKQIGWLKGYGKQNPLVAVQVNNQQGIPQTDDPARIGELIEQVTVLLESVKEVIGDKRPSEFREGSAGTTDAEPLGDMEQTVTEPPEIGGASGT